MKSGKWSPTLIDIVTHCGRPTLYTAVLGYNTTAAVRIPLNH